MKLNNEEKELLALYDKGKLNAVKNGKKEAAKYREYAKSTLQKNKRINIRISERDLIHLQKIAIAEGLPYQTLISSVLHKYISRSFRIS